MGTACPCFICCEKRIIITDLLLVQEDYNTCKMVPLVDGNEDVPCLGNIYFRDSILLEYLIPSESKVMKSVEWNSDGFLPGKFLHSCLS